MDESSPNLPAPPVAPIAATGELFLSYNRKDSEAVRQVREFLRTQGISVFLDRESLIAGRPWPDALEEALRRAQAVAVFYGESGLGTWQKREMSFALDRQAAAEKNNQSFPVIPIILQGADMERPPGFLLLNTWVDLSVGLTDKHELDALVRAVRGTGGQPAARPEPANALCPYRGLRAFREEDAQLFFGREVFASELLKKVQSQDLVAVVGPSGTGKSSVVQAGLLPLLRRERPPSPTWDSVLFTPGRRPFHNLAAALVAMWATDSNVTARLKESNDLGDLLKDGKVPLEDPFEQALRATPGTDRLLVVVDQFEELFTLTPEAERQGFVEALIKATTPARIKIVLTLRADFYGQALSLSRDLSDRFAGVVNLGPMKREELRRAIEEPARSVNLNFEQGLVERILEHIESQPGSLPLLEFALTQLCERRQGNTFTHEQYSVSGEIRGAISNRAEEQFELLRPEQRQALLRVMTRLVRVAAGGEEGSDTRERLVMSELDAEGRSSVKSFVDARLLVTNRNPATGEETVEVAHESLIKGWQRLRDQLDRDREFLLWRQRLAPFLNEWEMSKRLDEALLSSPLLPDARSWLKDREKELTPREREFIKRSWHREQKGRLKRKWAYGAGIALIVALIAGGIWWQLRARRLERWTRSLDYQIQSIITEAPYLTKTVSQSDKPEASYRWIYTLCVANKVDYARELLQRSFSSSGDRQGMGYAALADALMDLGRKEEATSAAKEALRTVRLANYNLEQGGPTVAVTLSRVGLDKEAEELAADLLKSAQKLNPNVRNGRLLAAAETFSKIGRKDEARRILEEISEKMLADKTSYLPDYIRSAEVFIAVDDMPAAKRAIDGYLRRRIVPSNPPDDWTRRSALGRVVALWVRMGMADEALASARASNDAAHRAELDLLIAEEFVSEKKIPEARQAVRDALQAINGRSEYVIQDVLVSAAEVLSYAGDNAEAKSLVEQALKSNSWKYNAKSLNRMASLLVILDMKDRVNPLIELAVKEIRESVRSDQERSIAFAELASVVANLGDYQYARTLADTCSQSEDRLQAYASIVGQLAKQNYPQFNGLLISQERTRKRRAREALLY